MLVAGRYRLLAKIGEGGMGSVWRARHEVTERDVAIKFLGGSRSIGQGWGARFLREAKLAGRMRHPGLTEVLDAGVMDDTAGGPFLVMELLDGIPLDRALIRTEKIPVGICLEIMHDVARAMEQVHEKGFVHRDLKPANVFLHRPGTGALVSKVLDFGISKAVSTAPHVTSPTLTRSGVIVGSPRYMSPEQAAGDRSIDARSDVHAMGVMLWECISGRPMFQGATPSALAAQILAHQRPRLDALGAAVPPVVADVVAQAVAIDREERFQSSEALAEAIEHAMHTIGHAPVLDARDGAARFFALMGPEAPACSEGTSLLPQSSRRTDASAPAVEMDEGREPPQRRSEPTQGPSPTRPAAHERAAPDVGARLKTVALVAAVLSVGAVVGVVVSRSLPASSPAAPLTTQVSSFTVLAVASEESVAPHTSAAPEPTVPTASSVPVPHPSPPPASPPTRTLRSGPAASSPGETKPTATPTSPTHPVNRGITESGL